MFIDRICLLVVLLCGILAAPAHAQDDLFASDAGLQAGASIQGALNDQTPRRVYYLDGSRGEVIRFRLNTISGNLDPVLTVFDSAGERMFSRDDTGGSADIDMSITLNANTRYYVVVGRFGYDLGTTSGEYVLSLERIGVLSDQGSNLQYGIPVMNRITNTQPQVYYTFRARTGDIVNIDMVRASGTLDPYVQVVNSDRFLVAANDDDPISRTQNARIENLLIEEGGTYIVIATRYGEAAGESVGSFVLTITEASNSGLGNSRMAPALLRPGQPVEGTIDDEQFERFYRFEAARDDLVTITMDQIDGVLDAYLILSNAGFNPIAEDDDGGSGRNARIDTYRIPADGTYYVTATRYEREAGETSGAYRLELRREGSAFDGVPATIPRLLYGTTVPDQITEEDPESLFAFWGDEGDVVTIRMNRASGDLNPVLELLDSSRQRMVRDDDSGGGVNAAIERFTLTYTGVHYIRASRYSGSLSPADTTGQYNLVLMLEG